MSVVLEHRYVPRGTAARLFECRDPEVLMAGPAGTGKAQPLDATVWTPTGPRQMRDLGVGDLVLTPDGGSAPITGIPFRGQAPVYRVTFSDGTHVECSDGHLWQVAWRDTSERQHERVLSLAALMNMGLRKRNGTRPKFWIPQTAPVEFDPQPVPIPPYTLGVLLGDGYLRDTEVSFTTADQEMADRVAAEMTPRYKVTTTTKPGNAAAAYRIVPDGWRTQSPRSGKAGYVSQTISRKWMARLRQPGRAATEALYIGSYDTRELAQAAIDERAHTVFTADQLAGVPGLQADIQQLGLRNARSATKFVPDAYKLNTAEVRWEILRGLMDTDGYAERSTVSFTSISKRLAEDVRWLVESLGGTARIATKQPPNGQLAYTVWIRLPQPEEAFALDRKRARVAGRQVPVRRWIESVEYVGEQECQCITVGTPEGLYLTDGFVVTHNSRACLEKLHMMALVNPGMRGLIVRKTQVSLGSTALVTWEKAVVEEALRAGDVKFYGGGPKEPASYRYSNGSVVVIGGMDKSIRIMSSEYDVCYVQEATELTENDWESITTRLRNGKVSFQQLIADCNPDTATHWLKVRADNGRTTMFESRHEENPVYFNEDGTLTEKGEAYIAKLDALTGVRYYRLRKGMWVSAEGVIFEEFDGTTHLVDKFKVPAEWSRYWTVDFGYNHPFVLQCWAEDPDGRLYLYRELFRTKRLVEDHAADIIGEVSRPDRAYQHPEGQARYAYHGRIWNEPKPRAIICDHDAEDRATLERHLGMSTRPAHKSVSDGIQAVQSRLKVAGDGKPRLMLMRDARVKVDEELRDASKPTCTAEEIPGYVWDTANGKKIKEEPLKEEDDGCDAMRYMVAERDLAPRPRVRTMGNR